MVKTELNSLAVILIFGSLILLSFLKLANPLHVNKKGNVTFGLFLLLWSTFWLDEIVFFSGKAPINAGFSMVLHCLQFFTPIVFYLSIVYFTNPDFKFRYTDVKYLIVPIVFTGIQLADYYADAPYYLHYIATGLLLLQTLFYTIVSYLRIRKHQKQILLFASNTAEIDLNWLEYIIFVIMAVSIIFSVYNVFFNGRYLNVFINSTFLVVIYIIAYYSLKQKEIFPFAETQRNEIISINKEQLADSKKKIVADDELTALKQKLTALMQVQKPYLDSELNLVKLSDMLDVTTHQLSYAINQGFNENFFQFINKYRVEKAKELLLQEDMNKLSILGIAFESGFNSKTSFNTTFKKITNVTPSEFKKTNAVS